MLVGSVGGRLIAGQDGEEGGSLAIKQRWWSDLNPSILLLLHENGVTGPRGTGFTTQADDRFVLDSVHPGDAKKFYI